MSSFNWETMIGDRPAHVRGEETALPAEGDGTRKEAEAVRKNCRVEGEIKKEEGARVISVLKRWLFPLEKREKNHSWPSSPGGWGKGGRLSPLRKTSRRRKVMAGYEKSSPDFEGCERESHHQGRPRRRKRGGRFFWEGHRPSSITSKMTE